MFPEQENNLMFDRGLSSFRIANTLGTTGFSRVRREFSVLAEGRHIFGRRPKPRAAKPLEKTFRPGHYKDLTETGNRARKVSGTQGRCPTIRKSNLIRIWADPNLQMYVRRT